MRGIGRRLNRGFPTRALIIFQASLCLLSRVAGENSGASDTGFRFHDKPLHPLLIKEFEPWISDERPPITVEVNVTAAWDSNQYATEFETDSNALVSVKLPEGGSYAYRHLGKLSDGTHVLRTFYSGGGSGSFEALLFARFRTSLSYLADGVKQREQVFLRVVRRYPLGDRDEAEVIVKPEEVIVGKSRYRSEPVVLTFPQTPTPAKAQKSN